LSDATASSEETTEVQNQIDPMGATIESMEMPAASNRVWRMLLGASFAGLLCGFGVNAMLAERPWTSAAVIRVSEPASARELAPALAQAIQSESTLDELVREYRLVDRERVKASLAISAEGDTQLRVAFTWRDRELAKRVVDDVAARIVSARIEGARVIELGDVQALRRARRQAAEAAEEWSRRSEQLRAAFGDDRQLRDRVENARERSVRLSELVRRLQEHGSPYLELSQPASIEDGEAQVAGK